MVSNGPDIIYTQQFRIANGSRYLKYTERDEAIKSPEGVFDSKLDNTKVQTDPDIPKDYKGYLGYTDRKAATKLERNAEGDYPTFNQDTFNITEAEHEKLINNLKEAQKNKALLWAGVVSFTPEFLKRSGIYDPRTKDVDQRKIKVAIQNAMPTLLAKEGLNNDETFWWGDIHLNTDHVHVHLAISQRHNTRPLKDNGEPVGAFHLKSIRQFKSIIHNQLEHSQGRKVDLELDKQIDTIRKDLAKNVRWLVEHEQYQKQLLQQIYWTLPKYKDKRKWRGSNNSKEFREAKMLTDKLVDDLLHTDLRTDYSQFVIDIKQKDQIAREKYGKHIKDTVGKRDKKLREYLSNRIYDYLRETDSINKSNVSWKEQIQVAGVNLNKQLLETEKQQLQLLDRNDKLAKQLRLKMGLRRYYIKQINLEAKKAQIDRDINQINQLDIDSAAGQFFLKSLKEQRRFVDLQLMTKFERNKKGLATEYQTLKNRYQDVQRLPISKATPELVNERTNQLGKELGIILDNPDSPIVRYFMPNPSSEYGTMNTVKYYEAEQHVLQLKLKIRQNNLIYQRDQGLRNQVNRPLLDRLKFENSSLNHSELIDHRVKLQQEFLRKKRQQAIERSLNSIKLPKLSQLLNGVKNDGRKRMKAMRRHLDEQEDEIEREDRKEDFER